MKSNAEHKIQLLILIPNLECGGAERFASVLCDHINTNTFEVTLAVLNNKNPFFHITNTAVEVIDLKVKRVRKSLFAIHKLVKNQQPDIIFSLSNHLNLYMAIYRWLFPRDISFIARESSIVSMNTKRTRFPALYTWLAKKFYHRFDVIICQSRYMQDDLIRHFRIPPGKTRLIYNPLKENNWTGISTVSKQKEKGVYTFITVARLSEEKGIDRIIQGLAGLTLSYRFYIIGDGNKKGELEGLISSLHLDDRIFLLGTKPDPFSGLEDADLFLMGSHYEGFPNVAAEAGALGIPVIAFDVPGGTREVIVPKENGLLVDDGDIVAFRAAIELGLRLNLDRNSISAFTKKRFPVQSAISELETLFREHSRRRNEEG